MISFVRPRLRVRDRRSTRQRPRRTSRQDLQAQDLRTPSTLTGVFSGPRVDGGPPHSWDQSAMRDSGRLRREGCFFPVLFSMVGNPLARGLAMDTTNCMYVISLGDSLESASPGSLTDQQCYCRGVLCTLQKTGDGFHRSPKSRWPGLIESL